ncbi:unnamed protein product [Caenorhabditis nigoni]
MPSTTRQCLTTPRPLLHRHLDSFGKFDLINFFLKLSSPENKHFHINEFRKKSKNLWSEDSDFDFDVATKVKKEPNLEPNRALVTKEQELFKKDIPELASMKHRLPAIHVEIKTIFLSLLKKCDPKHARAEN